MDCSSGPETGFNMLIFSLPVEGETDFKYEDFPLLSSNKDYITHKFIEIQCVNENVYFCKTKMSFLGRLNYTSLVGSEHHGVQNITMETHEYI